MSDVGNIKISELGSIDKDFPLTLSSLFMVSEISPNSTFLSKKLSCGYLENEFVNTLEKTKYFNPTGTWQAISGMTIPTRSVLSAYKAGRMDCVVNKEYLSSTFFKEFDKLSSYVKEIIPSSVGEIIYSTSLRTENDVKKHYGKHTSWVKVPGRFILATNSPNNKTDAKSVQVSEVNRTGGEDSTEITIRDIPNHSHTFIKNKDKQKFEFTFTWVGETPDNLHQIECLVQGDKSGKCEAKKQETATGEYYPVTAEVVDSEETESVKDDIWPKGNDAYMYGNHEDHPDRKYIFIHPNSGGRESFKHNNIPPYFAMYIWERVS